MEAFTTIKAVEIQRTSHTALVRFYFDGDPKRMHQAEFPLRDWATDSDGCTAAVFQYWQDRVEGRRADLKTIAMSDTQAAAKLAEM